MTDFRFEIFLYTSKPAVPQNLKRATQSRLRDADMKRRMFEVSNRVEIGKIEAAHQNVLNARDPQVEYIRHSDNTSKQAAALDREMEKAATVRATGPSDVVLNMEIDGTGIILPLKFDIAVLRQLLGLPSFNLYDHGIFSAGYSRTTASNPDMPDYDHI